MDDLAYIPDLKYVHDLEHVLDDKNTFLILKLIKLISVSFRSVPIYLRTRSLRSVHFSERYDCS